MWNFSKINMETKTLRYFVFLFLFVVIVPLLMFAKDSKVSELACFIEPYITVNLDSGVTGIGTFGIRIKLSNPNFTLLAGLKYSIRFLNH